jgi:hypothetical protein
MNELEVENGNVVSVYQGVRIDTGRRKGSPRKIGFGDLDPRNSKLEKLLKGDLDLSTLTDEEVRYGIPKCDDGKFSAKAAWQAAVLPPRIKSALQRELYKRADGKLHGALLPAVDSLVELATSAHVDDPVRLKAATYLFERLQGKTPDRVIHTQEAPWEVVLSEVRRGPRQAKADRIEVEDGNVVEAEVIPAWLEQANGLNGQ